MRRGLGGRGGKGHSVSWIKTSSVWPRTEPVLIFKVCPLTDITWSAGYGNTVGIQCLWGWRRRSHQVLHELGNHRQLSGHFLFPALRARGRMVAWTNILTCSHSNTYCDMSLCLFLLFTFFLSPEQMMNNNNVFLDQTKIYISVILRIQLFCCFALGLVRLLCRCITLGKTKICL